MADATGMYCPLCREQGMLTVPMMRNTFVFECTLNPMHKVEGYERLMAMKPDLIKLHFVEKPAPGTVKAEIYVRPETWEKYKAKYSDRMYVTIGAMIDMLLNDSLLIIEGPDAKALRDLYKITNSSSMLACAENEAAQSGTIETLTKEVQKYENMFSQALSNRMGASPLGEQPEVG